jgi:hypothetical protein
MSTEEVDAIAELKAQNEDLRERIARLEASVAPKPKPKEPEVKFERVHFDPTARASMPMSALREMVGLDTGSAVGDARALVAGREPSMAGTSHDFSHGGIKSTVNGPRPSGNGWQDAKPITPVGSAHERRIVDGMVRHQVGGPNEPVR